MLLVCISSMITFDYIEWQTHYQNRQNILINSILESSKIYLKCSFDGHCMRKKCLIFCNGPLIETPWPVICWTTIIYVERHRWQEGGKEFSHLLVVWWWALSSCDPAGTDVDLDFKCLVSGLGMCTSNGGKRIFSSKNSKTRYLI